MHTQCSDIVGFHGLIYYLSRVNLLSISVEGCTAQIKSKGVCARHVDGGPRLCSVEGCTSQRKSRGVCTHHADGGPRLCSVEGCTSQRKSRGVCSRHAGEIHAQTQAKRPRALPGLAAAAAQTEAMGLHTSDIPGVTVAAGNAAYHAGFGHGGAAAVAAAAVQAAAEAEATAAELMQHYAGPAAAVARGDVKEGHELLTALHDRLRADPTTRARYVEAGLAMLAELLSLAEGSIADDGTRAALKGLLHDGALLDVLGLGEARAAVERVLRERALCEAVAAQRNRLAAAAAAKAAQHEAMGPDTYADVAFGLEADGGCCPRDFDGTGEHSPSEVAAVNRRVTLGLLLQPSIMPSGVRKLHDALPPGEQAKWAEVREHLHAQRASAVSIHGECEEVEQLDRATRLQMAILVNERLTYYGVPLFHSYARSEMYPARLLGEDVVDADTFQRRIERLLKGGMRIGEGFWLDQCPQSAADKLVHRAQHAQVPPAHELRRGPRRAHPPAVGGWRAAVEGVRG